jgi:hypothetical protein
MYNSTLVKQKLVEISAVLVCWGLLLLLLLQLWLLLGKCTKQHQAFPGRLHAVPKTLYS